MTRILLTLITALALFATTAKAEEADDGWDCKKPLEYVNGSADIGWTMLCDEVVWLCPAEADDDKDILQSECHKAVPSRPAVAPAPAPTPPPVPHFPVMGLTAPELYDPPLRAYTYMPMNPGEWKVCDECAKVELDPTQTYLVYGERPGSVSVLVAEFVEAPVICGNFNQDGLVKDSEIVGVPAVPEGTMFLYLRGRHGVSTPFYVKVVSDDDHPDYWTVVGKSSPQSISGHIKGPQNELSVKNL